MNKPLERQLAFAFGVVFLTVLIVSVFFLPNPTPFQYTVLRIVLALAAAGVAVTFTGFIAITVATWIKAGGALAIFVIVFFYNPASLAPLPAPKASASPGLHPLVTASIPPGRLLKASPFRVRLDDCTRRTCNVELVLRAYDPQGRLRYDARAQFNQFVIGQYRDTVFNTADQMYFEAGEKATFLLYCRIGNGPFQVGEQSSLGWRPWNEGSELKEYYSWLSCGNNDFKSSVGITVAVADTRINEPPVKKDTGPPR